MATPISANGWNDISISAHALKWNSISAHELKWLFHFSCSPKSEEFKFVGKPSPVLLTFVGETRKGSWIRLENMTHSVFSFDAFRLSLVRDVKSQLDPTGKHDMALLFWCLSRFFLVDHYEHNDIRLSLQNHSLFQLIYNDIQLPSRHHCLF